MRISTSSFKRINTNETLAERKARVLARRVVFKWLPVQTENDMVCGAWWFVWGSVLTFLIPIFPLISLFESFWPVTQTGIPVADHVAAYAMLVFAGVCYTLGSWVFARTFREPTPPPLVPFWYFANDELFATWCFVAGTIPSVPIMAIYCYYYQSNSLYRLALALCVLFSFAFLAYIVVMSPRTKAVYEQKKQQALEGSKENIRIVSPLLHHVFCTSFGCYCPKEWAVHVSNDWLILCWITLFGSVFAVFISIAMLVDSVKNYNQYGARGVFDWVTGLVDMILFTIGAAYFVAGSYPQGDGPESESKQALALEDSNTSTQV